MGCRELHITDYFRLTPTTGSLDTIIAGNLYSSEKSHRGFKPVIPVLVSNYRYYSPEIGRWLSRDPIEEVAFLLVQKQEKPDFFQTLYGFVKNNAINGYDKLGTVGPASPIVVIRTGVQVTNAMQGFAICLVAKQMCNEDALNGDGRYPNNISYWSNNPFSLGWNTYTSICCVCKGQVSFTCMINGNDEWCR